MTNIFGVELRNPCVLIAVPTYNESENIDELCRRLASAIPEADILIIDDNSPDGTADRVRRIMNAQSKVRLIVRESKGGIGSAHMTALRVAHSCNSKVLVTLDADLTHNPEDIPKLLAALDGIDVVVGSRFMEGGGLHEWALLRRITTHGGHLLTRLLLGIRYDATGALRAYRLGSLTESLMNKPLHKGYPFMYQSLTWLARSGATIKEVPIVLTPRAYGSSKMGFSDVMLGFIGIFGFAISHRFKKASVGNQ